MIFNSSLFISTKVYAQNSLLINTLIHFLTLYTHYIPPYCKDAILRNVHNFVVNPIS